MKKGFSVRKLSLIAMLLSIALVLSIIEGRIPFGIPGLKIGLANMVILLAIYYFGFTEAFLIDLARVIIASIATGTFMAMGFFMSLAGAMVSFFIMYLSYKVFKFFTPVGTSILGAYSHSLAQIHVGVWYLGSMGIFYYFPLMALVSLITGTFNGFLVEALLENKTLNQAVNKIKEN